MEPVATRARVAGSIPASASITAAMLAGSITWSHVAGAARDAAATVENLDRYPAPLPLHT